RWGAIALPGRKSVAWGLPGWIQDIRDYSLFQTVSFIGSAWSGVLFLLLLLSIRGPTPFFRARNRGDHVGWTYIKAADGGWHLYLLHLYGHITLLIAQDCHVPCAIIIVFILFRVAIGDGAAIQADGAVIDRKCTRLNSS